MRITEQLFLKLITLLALEYASTTPLAAQHPVMIDGTGRASSVETTSIMRCENFRVELRFREERFDPDRTLSLDQALRVTLLGLTVSERLISPAERARVAEFFQSLAWIDDTDLRCTDERVQINLIAMSKAEWNDYFEKHSRRTEEHSRERPRARSRTIGISPEGHVTIDGPSL